MRLKKQQTLSFDEIGEREETVDESPPLRKLYILIMNRKTSSGNRAYYDVCIDGQTA
jgi:hypothetical protein